ncbi:MAG: NAD(P)H-dependent flavin oxidoreductase [Oscillospiraceae bacterium]
MIKTRLTELVGIKYPIIQAGMGPFPVTELCIAAANAGCLGLLSTAALQARKEQPEIAKAFIEAAHAEWEDDDVTVFKKMFLRVFEETKDEDGIFGANVMVSMEMMQNAQKVMQAIKEVRDENPEMKRRFKVLVTSAGDPMPWGPFVQEQGMVWMHVFPNLKSAKRCKKAGVQVLIASGHEGGFHTSWQPVHSMTLLPDVVEKFSDENTLVCGTGGFCDGKSLAAAFAMGADGVQMGTRFLATQESDFSDLWKQMLIEAQDGGTLIARGFVGPARWLRTPRSQLHAENTLKKAPGAYLGIPDDFTSIDMSLVQYENESLNATAAGDREHAMAAAGECAQRIDDLPKTKDMVQKVMADAEEIVKNMAGKYLE